MTPQELWNQYKRVNPNIGDSIDAWQFGAEPDQLAQLVLKELRQRLPLLMICIKLTMSRFRKKTVMM